MYQRFRYAMLAICGMLALGMMFFSAQAAFAQSDDDYAPNWTGYQGYLTNDDGSPYNGTVDLYYAIYDADADGDKKWSKYYDNWMVDNGYFDIKLGGDDKPLGHTHFDSSKRYVEVRVCRGADCADTGEGDGWETMPRQSMGSTPYAMRAHRAYSATHATYAYSVDWDDVMNKPAMNGGGGYKYHVTVAKEGGDYTSVYDAMESITDATKDTPYMLYVAPGKYEETKTIVTKPYVYVKGAGKGSTEIYNGTTDKTMVLYHNVTMSHMTVRNDYGGGNSYAVYAHETDYSPVYSTYLHDMNAYADYYDGNSYNEHNHYGAYMWGADVKVDMKDVHAYGSWGTKNYGAYMTDGAKLHSKDSNYYGSYGENTYGLYSTGAGSHIEAYGGKSYGRYGVENNYGLYNHLGAKAKVTEGKYYGYWGEGAGKNCYGMWNEDAELEAHYSYGYGWQCSEKNYGLYNNYDAAETKATVKYTYYQAYKGYNGWGVYNNAAELKAYYTYGYADQTAYDETVADSGKAYGLYNANGANAYMKGGTYRGYEGYNCWGIANNAAAGSTINAYGVDAYAKHCDMEHYGVYNQYGTFTAYDGNFYAQAEPTGGAAGQTCYGIWNGGDDGNSNYGTYYGYDATVWGKYCTGTNVGLRNAQHGMAETYNGTYYGYGGDNGFGLYCSNDGSTVHGNNSNYYATKSTALTYGWAAASTCEAEIAGGNHYADANGGVAYGGYCYGKCSVSNAKMMAKGAAAENYGFYNDYDAGNAAYRSTAYVDSVNITAKDTGTDRWAMYVEGGDVYASNSKWDDDGDNGNSWGGNTGSGGELKCAGVHDEELDDANCPQGPLLP